MKKTPPVGMGSVASDWPIPTKTLEWIDPRVVWKMPDPVKPDPKVTVHIPEGVKRKLLTSIILGMVPKSEKYEWHVRGEYDLPTMSFRLDLGLSDKYITNGTPLRIHSTVMISDEELLYSNPEYLQHTVDQLVKSIVGELARIEKGRKPHDDQNVSRETEWEVS